jgi:hypothetical protein
MTFTFKLEHIDGTPADPPSFKTTVLVWKRRQRAGSRFCAARWPSLSTSRFEEGSAPK